MIQFYESKRKQGLKTNILTPGTPKVIFEAMSYQQERMNQLPYEVAENNRRMVQQRETRQILGGQQTDNVIIVYTRREDSGLPVHDARKTFRRPPVSQGLPLQYARETFRSAPVSRGLPVHDARETILRSAPVSRGLPLQYARDTFWSAPVSRGGLPVHDARETILRSAPVSRGLPVHDARETILRSAPVSRGRHDYLVTKEALVLGYKTDAFPTLNYNLKSYQRFVQRRKLNDDSISTFNSSENAGQFTIIAAGDTDREEYVRLLSKKKASTIDTVDGVFNLKSEDNYLWQDIPLVYFLRDSESIPTAIKEVVKISRQIPKKLSLHYVFVSHKSTEDLKTWRTPHGVDCVQVPYSKDIIRKVVSIILEKPIFESLHRFENDIPSSDMQAHLEVKTLLKHERFIQKCNNVDCGQMVPLTVADTLMRQKDVTAFGIWQDKFFIFLKKLKSVDDQTDINSMLQKADDSFFNKMTPNYIYTDSFIVTKCIRQGDALYRKDEGLGVSQGATVSCQEKQGTIGALLRNATSTEKVYGITAGHLLPMVNAPAFTKREGNLHPCGKCVLALNDSDIAFLEFENECRDMCVTVFHDETEKPRRTRVYQDSVGMVGKVHKKGANTDWTEGMIISPETYANIFEGGKYLQCIVVEGTSGRFSSPGDSGSVIFAHSPDHSHLQAIGIVCAGNLEIRDPKWSKEIGREEADMKEMTIACKLQRGFDEARSSNASYNFDFEDVQSSESDED